ncbi:MAG: Wzz/FepE/Etk N-terminal domain-containing protein [Chloroflexota bacterium]
MDTMSDTKAMINYQMEEEIDLRQYVMVLIKYRYWILGLAIVAAVIAFAISSFTPAAYEATALVTATQSRYELQFDPRFRNVPDSAIQSLLESQYLTYPTLATSDDLLQQVAGKVDLPMSELKTAIKAQTENAPNLLALTVKSQNPEAAAAIANTWAELFVAKANSLYGSKGELAQFMQQQQIVAQSLAEADAALTTFRAESGLGFNSPGVNTSTNDGDGNSNTGSSNSRSLIELRLQSKNNLMTTYETELARLRQRQRELELLQETAAGTSPVLMAGLLSEMINAGVVEEAQPYQIKLEAIDPVTGLAAMAKVFESRTRAIEVELGNLNAEILTLQAELAGKREKLEQLMRDRDVKAEAYAVISRKVQEAQIDASSEGSSTGKVQIASRAAAPTSPISAGRVRNTAVAGVLGLMIGVFGAFAWEWWRTSE